MSDYMRELRAQVGNMLLEVPAAGVVLRDAQDRILLVHHAEGVWTIPGGAIEPEEAPADAAVREVLEETGAHVELTRLLGVYGGPEFVVRYRNGDRSSYLMVIFMAELRGGELRPDGVETLELGTFTRREIDGLERPEWLDTILNDAFEPAAEARFRAPTANAAFRTSD